MGKKVQYGQSNNVESARTFSAGTKCTPPKSTALKTSALNSTVILKVALKESHLKL